MDDYDGSISRAVFDHGKARLAGRKQRRMFGMRIVLSFLIFETVETAYWITYQNMNPWSCGV